MQSCGRWNVPENPIPYSPSLITRMMAVTKGATGFDRANEECSGVPRLIDGLVKIDHTLTAETQFSLAA